MESFNKILIIKPSSLGDVVHSLAFLHALKSTYPDASIQWVISKGLSDLLAGHPMVDKLWIINKDRWKKPLHFIDTLKELRKLFTSLHAEHFDIVVDLQGLLRSGLIARATHAPMILGFKEAREGSRYFYTHLLDGGKNIHAVDRYLKMATFLGCNISNIQFPFNVDSGQQSVKGKFSLPDQYAVLVPGARWKTKRWPAKRFGQVASKLPLQSVILGSKADHELADEATECSQGKALSLAGRTTLKELVFVISRARFMITNDTGPMHIASALNIPVVALFGPTDPKKTGPYGNIHKVITANAPCAPCLRKRCKTLSCMKEILPEHVMTILTEELFPSLT